PLSARACALSTRRPPPAPLFPYTTLFRSALSPRSILVSDPEGARPRIKLFNWQVGYRTGGSSTGGGKDITATSHVELLVEDTGRSEEHTSELQSLTNLVCRLLLVKQHNPA